MQAGGVLCLEGSQDGRMAYSGGHDGRVLAHDIRYAVLSHNSTACIAFIGDKTNLYVDAV